MAVHGEGDPTHVQKHVMLSRSLPREAGPAQSVRLSVCPLLNPTSKAACGMPYIYTGPERHLTGPVEGFLKGWK